MTTPRVSIVIPAYNMAAFVSHAIESALGQTYDDCEIIVVDDGSVDETGAIVRRFEPRVRYVYQDNAGANAARNHGIRLARGSAVALLDADDVWLPHKLERQVALLDSRPDVKLVGCGYSERDASLKTVVRDVVRRNFPSHDKLLEALSIAQLIPGSGSGVLIAKECFDVVGMFDETLKVAEDWDMWLRIVSRYNAAFVEEVLVLIRKDRRNKPQYRTLTTEQDQVEFVIRKNVSKERQPRALAALHARLGSQYLFRGRPQLAFEHLLRSLRLHPWRIYPRDPDGQYAFPRSPRVYLAIKSLMASALSRRST
jgi:glycosyltransferase involved in cell wall biosynthesis